MDKDTIILALLVVYLLLYFLPRSYVRHFRRYPIRFIYWQWKKMSLASALVYSWLYNHINGNNNDED